MFGSSHHWLFGFGSVSVLLSSASPPPALLWSSLLLRGLPHAHPTSLLSLCHFVIMGSRGFSFWSSEIRCRCGSSAVSPVTAWSFGSSNTASWSSILVSFFCRLALTENLCHFRTLLPFTCSDDFLLSLSLMHAGGHSHDLEFC